MTCSYKSSRVILVAALVAMFFNCAFAHTYLSSVFLNNQALGEGDCVRPHPSTAYDSPIPLVTSPDMTCGWLPKANEPANRKCPVAAGSMFGLQWYHTAPGPHDDIVERTHVGPIMVYMAKSDTGAGNVWFKIYEDGFSNGKWAVDKLIDNRGRVDIKIPDDIAPGNYLLRGEILALHGAYDLNGIQPYVGCVELTISGNGKANPSGVAFPGFYKNTDPGMLFNRYQGFTSYPIPGPALYKPSSSSSSSGSNNNNNAPSTQAPSTQAPSTQAPAATYPPSSNNNNNIKLTLNGANQWYIGVVVNGGGETTVKVEMTDSGSVKNWATMIDKSYAYAYSAAVPVVLPISIRVTSSSGKVVVLQNIFNSFSGSVDSGKTFASSSNANPTYAPSTPAATTRPTDAPSTPAPTTRPPTNGNNAKVSIYGSSTQWWFALSVAGASEDISKVEIKDSGVITNFVSMTSNNWGSTVYTYSAQGTAIATPITLKITSKSGKSVTATISQITPNAVIDASGPL